MIEILFDPKTIFKKTSDIVEQSIEKMFLEKDEIVLGLPGGRSITRVLEFLKKKCIDWDRIHVFMVDERLVPLNDNDNNFRLIKQELSKFMPEKNLHPFPFDENKPDFGLEDYQEMINNLGGIFDIVFLSSGEDGHIGSLFPNHPSIFDESEGYILVENSPKLPRRRISISKKFLLKTKIGILLFVGDMKQEAYLKFLDENLDITICPAKLVAQLPESFVLTNIRLNEELI